MAAGQDDRARAARLRAGAGERRVERAAEAPPAGCTPSRGTSWSRSPPARRTAPGSTCAPATASVRRSPSTSCRAWPSSCPAGSATATRRWPTRRRTPTWSTTTGVPTRRTSRSTTPIPRSAIDWPVPPDERELSDKDRTAPLLADVTPVPVRAPLVLGADGQLGRALTAALPGAARRHPGRARPHRRRRPRALAVARPRRRAQRGGLHRGRRRGDRRRPRGRLGGQRRRSGGPGPAGGATRLHARALLHRLRLRRRPAASTTRTSRWPPSASTASRRPRATSPSPPPLATTSSAPRGWSATARTSCAPWPAWPADGVSPSVVADQVGRLTFTDEIVRGTRAPARRRRAVRHLPPDQRRAADVVGRRRARGLRAARPRSRRRQPRRPPRSTPRGVRLAPRPANSVLSTQRIEATGFEPVDAREALRAYASSLP